MQSSLRACCSILCQQNGLHDKHCLIGRGAADKIHEHAVLSLEVYCPNCKNLGVQSMLAFKSVSDTRWHISILSQKS